MSVVSMRELLEAGVHFGHQTRRWNPKMRRFIFTERGGIYIIDLQQTLQLLEDAHAYARNLSERGGTMLFVGTKKQAQDAISEQATRVSMPYVNHRWLGGLLTNWRTISDRIERLHDLRRLRDEGQLELLPAKERISMLGELEKLEANLGGVADMRRQPDAIFIVDLRKEQLAVREARRLGIKVVALVDTNCDPDEADFVIPGNDDAIRSCSLVVRAVADGIEAGRQGVKPQEFQSAPAAEEAAAEPPVGDGGPGQGDGGNREVPAAESAAVEEPTPVPSEPVPTQPDVPEPTPVPSEPVPVEPTVPEPTPVPSEPVPEAPVSEGGAGEPVNREAPPADNGAAEPAPATDEEVAS